MSNKNDLLFCPKCGARLVVCKLFGLYYLEPSEKVDDECLCANFLEYHTTRENIINAWLVTFARYKRNNA